MIFSVHVQRTTWSFRSYLKLGLLLCAALVVAGAYVGWQFVAPAGKPGPLVSFRIAQGEGVHQVSDNLAAAKLVHSQFWFETWVWLTGTEGEFQKGEYYLPPEVNSINLVRLLTGMAQPANEVALRFIEGWRIKQMGDYVASVNFSSSRAFTEVATTRAQFAPLVKESGLGQLLNGVTLTSLEGYLFPDTYRVFRDSAPSDLVLKMLTTFVQRFDPAWVKALAVKNKTVNQAVILASIVEREVKTDEDRAMVADIFWRRLEVGQGLEADSTINYITGKADPSVSAKDLATTSPNNTYRYRGLPPGPISNPSLSSLRAVVHPKANPYWYFLSTADGRVIYSKTFSDHVKAKQLYLR
jgi:UPF0755 protein